MRSIEELKKEQYDLKARLHEVIELMNNEEFYSLPSREKALITQQRAGMELYLSSLTKRIYESSNTDSPDTFWLSLLMGMLSSSWSTPSMSSLTEKDFDKKDDDEQIYAMPV